MPNELYGEIPVENALQNHSGKEVKRNPGAHVNVIAEADRRHLGAANKNSGNVLRIRFSGDHRKRFFLTTITWMLQSTDKFGAAAVCETFVALHRGNLAVSIPDAGSKNSRSYVRPPQSSAD
jgi:hypothetical protein